MAAPYNKDVAANGGGKRPHRTHSDSPQAQAERVPRRTFRQGELALAWGVSRWKIIGMIDSGQLGTVNLDGLRVVPLSEVERVERQGFQRRPRPPVEQPDESVPAAPRRAQAANGHQAEQQPAPDDVQQPAAPRRRGRPPKTAAQK